jgi:hypothetical protein
VRSSLNSGGIVVARSAGELLLGGRRRLVELQYMELERLVAAVRARPDAGLRLVEAALPVFEGFRRAVHPRSGVVMSGRKGSG